MIMKKVSDDLTDQDEQHLQSDYSMTAEVHMVFSPQLPSPR